MMQTQIFGFNNPQSGRRTPNRAYNQPATAMNFHQNRQDLRSLSPNKLNATKKPMIGRTNNLLANNRNPPPSNYGTNPKNNQKAAENVAHNYRSSNNEQGRCQNHLGKNAEFVAYIEGDRILYCQKCALNIASNGFEVNRINSQSPRVNSHSNKFFLGSAKAKLQPFNFPEYCAYEGYNELQGIINELDGVHSKYSEQLRTFSSIQQHYEQQYNLTERFYQDLMRTLEQMKEDHLADLIDMSKKHIQLAYIKQDHLKNDVEEMEVIRNDIINSLQIILENFKDPLTEKNLGFYKQQIYAYSEKVDEEKVQFQRELISYKPEELDYRLNLIQEYLLDVWDIKLGQKVPQEDIKNHPNSARNQQRNYNKPEKSPINNIMHLGKGNQTKKQATGTACRKLFDEEDDLDANIIAGQTSPQFKII